MRHRRALVALALLFTAVTAGTCLYPTERDASVHVSIAPLKILIRGNDTVAAATAWQLLGSGDSQPIPNVLFVWSSSAPAVATVDNAGRIVGVNSGSAVIRAAAANFDKGARPGQAVLRVSAPLEVDSVRPLTVKYGQTATVYGVGVDSIFQMSLGAAVLIPYAFFVQPQRDATGYAQARFWVPPPARTDSLFFIGNGVFGFTHDTVGVVRRDLFEPNETSPSVIDLETSRPFPGTVWNFLLFLNPALAFELLPRDVAFGADWYRLQQTASRDLTISVNSDVPGTFQTFLTDSLGYRASDSTYFIGRDAWTFGPSSHACHGAAFAPKEAPSESTVVALKGFPAGSLDAIAVYAHSGRYSLAVSEGYALSDPRIPRDAHEEDNYCTAVDLRVDTLSPQFLDTLAIENPHDVDWFRFHVPGTGLVPVRFRTVARPIAVADSSDIDLYVLNIPAPGDTLMTGIGFAKAGSTVDSTLTLTAGKDYYAVVVDFAGVPTRYTICMALVAIFPPSPNCNTLPPASVAAPSPAQVQASVARRARLDAVIRRRGAHAVPLRPGGSLR